MTIYVSHSSVADHRACPRKTFFRRIHKFKLRPKKSQALGVAFHAAKGRWYAHPSDQPVPFDVFPPGWEKVTENGHTFWLTANEQALLQDRLYAQIDAGIMVRRRGYQSIEHKITRDLGVVSGEPVQFIGFIDLLESGPQAQDHAVIDFKTSRNRKWMVKTPEALAYDVQLGIYVHETMADRAETRVEHHQAMWEPKGDEEKVAVVRGSITRAQAKETWQSFSTGAVLEATDRVRLQKIPVESWADVRGPVEHGACDAYGGCAFRDICARMKSIPEFKASLAVERNPADLPRSAALDLHHLIPTPMTSNPFAHLPGAAPLPVPLPQVPLPEARPQEPAPEPIEWLAKRPDGSTVYYAIEKDAPPWRDPACGMCSGKGYMKKHEADGRVTVSACLACSIGSVRTGRVMSHQFKIEAFQHEGQQLWVFSPKETLRLDPDGKPWGVPVSTAPVPVPPAAPAPVAAPTTMPLFNIESLAEPVAAALPLPVPEPEPTSAPEPEAVPAPSLPIVPLPEPAPAPVDPAPAPEAPAAAEEEEDPIDTEESDEPEDDADGPQMGRNEDWLGRPKGGYVHKGRGRRPTVELYLGGTLICGARGRAHVSIHELLHNILAFYYAEHIPTEDTTTWPTKALTSRLGALEQWMMDPVNHPRFHGLRVYAANGLPPDELRIRDVLHRLISQKQLLGRVIGYAPS